MAQITKKEVDVVVCGLGWAGFASVGIFVFILTVGLIYEWKKGALEWE